MNTHVPILKEIFIHRRLAAKRCPMYAQNRFARVLLRLLAGTGVIYLFLLGCQLPSVLAGWCPQLPPQRTFSANIIYLLVIDFVLRCSMQNLPVQPVKPYAWLPINRGAVIRAHLTLTLTQGINYLWLAFLIPFTYHTLYPLYGLTGMCGFVLGMELLLFINNYWYLLCRMLISRSLIYMLLPIGIYLILIIGQIFPGNNLGHLTLIWASSFVHHPLIGYSAAIAGMLLLFYICQLLQQRMSYDELSRSHQGFTIPMRGIPSFLARLNETGDYISLELKLLTRNKVPRQRFFTGLVLMIAFSILLAFTHVYDNEGMITFICIYNFSVSGIMVLTHTMNYEGNYMDGLMSRKESILHLLKAKYYVQCALLGIPLLLMTLPISQGKLHWLDALSCLFLTSGFTFWLLMQSAVYNNHTLSLNSPLTGNSSKNASLQTLFTLGALFLPILLINVFTSLFGTQTGMLILLITGLLMTLLHPLWMRHIYHRFMHHRYDNMAGFRSTTPHS